MSANLASELATPLNALERAHGGSAHRLSSSKDPESVAALWELLAYVMGERYAPRPVTVGNWKKQDAAFARRWGERELARMVLGESGRPGFSPPAVLAKYVERWEAVVGGP